MRDTKSQDQGAQTKTTRSDRAWERMGAVEPYYGVKPERGYLKDNLDAAARAEFFRTGEYQLEQTLRIIRQRLDENFNPARALDYGCGVGRVLIPLARRVSQVVGCDVSSSMLDEARVNCDRSGVTNVSFARADDRLSAVPGSFNFIFSDAVFQHIHPGRVDLIFRALLDRLDEGGICVVGFVIDTPSLQRFARWINRTLPFVDRFVTRVRGYRGGSTALESHVYALERAVARLMEAGYEEMLVQFFRGPHVTRARVFVRRGTAAA
ncbi:MAG: methyltransferase domain-containing protein, partial [Deltaproteobacteria bacterium]|nr:methyltransferase domain-containing protein [Deltaproteobacteria bacterium]